MSLRQYFKTNAAASWVRPEIDDSSQVNHGVKWFIYETIVNRVGATELYRKITISNFQHDRQLPFICFPLLYLASRD